jgi:hypothetical protein
MSNHETTAALDQNEIDHLIGMCPDWAMHHATDNYPGLSAFLMRCMSAMVAQRTENERLRVALRVIAGDVPAADNLLGNADVARIALHGS